MNERQDYIDEKKETLEKVRGEIELLQSDADRAKPSKEEEYTRELHELWRDFEDVEELLRNLEEAHETADEDEWEEVTHNFDEELAMLAETLSDARQEIDDI